MVEATKTGTLTLAAAVRIICLSLSKYSPGEKDSKATIPWGSLAASGKMREDE
jgi:hypothetical protein